MELGICDLRDILRMEECLEEDFVRYVMGEIVDGLVYLRYKGVLHRDIKPGNVVFMEDLSVKLIDFGT